MKTSKDSSAKYSQKTLKDFKQKLVKVIRIFLKRKKTKNANLVAKRIIKTI